MKKVIIERKHLIFIGYHLYWCNYYYGSM